MKSNRSLKISDEIENKTKNSKMYKEDSGNISEDFSSGRPKAEHVRPKPNRTEPKVRPEPSAECLAEPNPSGRTQPFWPNPANLKYFFYVFLLKYSILEAFSLKVIGSPNPFTEYLTKPNLTAKTLSRHCSASSSAKVQPWVWLD